MAGLQSGEVRQLDGGEEVQRVQGLSEIVARLDGHRRTSPQGKSQRSPGHCKGGAGEKPIPLYEVVVPGRALPACRRSILFRLDPAASLVDVEAAVVLLE